MSSGRGNAFTATRTRPSTHKSLLVDPKPESRSQRSPEIFHSSFSCGSATTESHFFLGYRTSHEVMQTTPMPELRRLAEDLLVFDQSRTQCRLQTLWNRTEHR
jgi:hypothetical protein